MVNAGPLILVVLATLLAYKFFMWNQWKVHRAVAQTRKIVKAPAAVNLTVSKDGTLLHRQSFEFNEEGNYYIVNRFDIGSYIGEGDRLGVDIDPGRSPSEFSGLHRFDKYNIVVFSSSGEKCYFVFTTGKFDVEDYIGLRTGIPRVIDSIND